MNGDRRADSRRFSFVDVNLVTMRDPTVLAHQTVVVTNTC